MSRTWKCRFCKMPAVYPNKACSLCQATADLFADSGSNRTEQVSARGTDPDTSKKAETANVVARQTQRRMILGRMLDGPVSSHEVADICGGQNGTAARRLTDLKNDGLITPCGEIKEAGRGGTPRRIYRLTDDGTRDAELMAARAS